LNDAGIPAGPVLSIDEVFADPQVQHLVSPLALNTQLARAKLRCYVIQSRSPIPQPESPAHLDDLALIPK
jgi:crotonobetainyl-CoA:carnitine CoA-transferase CaiB-like acyl-CoA transferase